MTTYKTTSGDYVITCNAGAGNLTVNGHTTLTLPNYTVAQVGNLVGNTTGQIVYVTNGNSGTPCLAVYNGSAWLRVALGNAISSS